MFQSLVENPVQLRTSKSVETPAARYCHSATVLNGCVYIFGGLGLGVVLNDLCCFDIGTSSSDCVLVVILVSSMFHQSRNRGHDHCFPVEKNFPRCLDTRVSRLGPSSLFSVGK
jgi:hypothetical protein